MKLHCGKTWKQWREDRKNARIARAKQWHYKFVWRLRLGEDCYVLHWMERRQYPYFSGITNREWEAFAAKEIKPYKMAHDWQWREPLVHPVDAAPR